MLFRYLNFIFIPLKSALRDVTHVERGLRLRRITLRRPGLEMTFDYAFILSTLPAFLKAVGVTLQVGLIAIATSLLVALINSALLVFRTRTCRAWWRCTWSWRVTRRC